MAKRHVHVKIPAGVDNGSRLRLQGEGGEGGPGGPPGDLYVFIQVEPHEFFQREDNNIICEIPLSFVQVALGADINVPTLDGKRTLTVPQGTQSGEVFMLRGEGIRNLRGYGRGDQYVRVLVRTPVVNLSMPGRRLPLCWTLPLIRISPEPARRSSKPAMLGSSKPTTRNSKPAMRSTRQRPRRPNR
jgi:DnaJ-class molecular chaperone